MTVYIEDGWATKSLFSCKIYVFVVRTRRLVVAEQVIINLKLRYLGLKFYRIECGVILPKETVRFFLLRWFR